MFVLVVNYTAPLERIDELRPAHVAYLQEHYADGTFLVSGRQRPPAGGVIVAADADRAEVVDREVHAADGAAGVAEEGR
ncbi:MAG TPA: YciI family protein, partial [Kineosporiaceae bacterium]|nr:YciI family protein [Kineosporiaceae bacterium]